MYTDNLHIFKMKAHCEMDTASIHSKTFVTIWPHHLIYQLPQDRSFVYLQGTNKLDDSVTVQFRGSN